MTDFHESTAGFNHDHRCRWVACISMFNKVCFMRILHEIQVSKKLETFGRMDIGLWLLRSVRAPPLDTGSSYSGNLPWQWEISFLNNRSLNQCFFFFFYQRPTVFSVTFCLTAILRAWQLSGKKRPSDRSLVEQRQGTTQWHHTQRDHYQAYSS